MFLQKKKIIYANNNVTLNNDSIFFIILTFTFFMRMCFFFFFCLKEIISYHLLKNFLKHKCDADIMFKHLQSTIKHCLYKRNSILIYDYIYNTYI